MTAGDTLSQAIPLHQVQHIAMGPQLTHINKPRHPLAGRGAREPCPTNPSSPGPNRALLHLTMKPTAQLRTALEEEKHYIREGLTDDVITLATNTLAAVTDTWDDAVGHPKERKDMIQEKQDTLTPELMDQLVQFTGPTEQGVPRIGLKVTDWTVLDHTPDTPTMCLQHTCWVTQLDGKGTATRVRAHTLETRTATPLALGDGFRHCSHHTNRLLAHWLALKTAMRWTVDASGTTLQPPHTWLALARNPAAYVRRHGMTQTQHWISWPTDTEQIIKIRTAKLQTHANKMQGMHRPREGHGPAYSIFQGRKASKATPQPVPEPVRPKPRPRPEGAGAPARRSKRPKPTPRLVPPEPKLKPQTCPYFSPDERKAMHPEYHDGVEV